MHHNISILDLTGVLQQTVKTPVVICAGSESLSTTIQEDHPDVVCFTSLCYTTSPEITFPTKWCSGNWPLE